VGHWELQFGLSNTLSMLQLVEETFQQKQEKFYSSFDAAEVIWQGQAQSLLGEERGP
jgi:hypothetical protein